MRNDSNQCFNLHHSPALATIMAGALMLLVATGQMGFGQDADLTETDPTAAAAKEAAFLSKVRQLTFEGRRAGEGYFSQDGKQLVFQSEREPGNPFYQIYWMDLETGDVERVSPGRGKTTCAWIHPDGNRVLFGSTHADGKSRDKQQQELEFRASGQQRRYAWDYDEEFDLFEYDRNTKQYKQLTKANGYDAEASWSPDGKLIAFTSNRRGYEGDLTADERKNFDLNVDYLNDIYLMNADGTNVRQLTTTYGYDGGPFFSPDGQRICWRRFTPNGAIAEIWTMNVDGSDKRQLTRLGAMSWAPYYHPSGEYLVFTTNRHGFSNFELYLIDVDGRSAPVRVTHTKGFDGLPVFTPDGQRLAWTATRTTTKQSQLFLADWDHQRARQMLGLDSTSVTSDVDTTEAQAVAAAVREQASAGFSPQDALRHVDYLCRKELGGRLTGTLGEKNATAYVASYLDSLGIEPAGDEGGWFQEFAFTSGVAMGDENKLTSGTLTYQVDRQWRPLSFSGTGTFDATNIVFAGYGMQVPERPDQEEYDSYVHLDVKDKWVMVFRYMPEQVSAERRQQLSRASQLRFKATVARGLGARGMIVVTGPNAKAKSELVPLRLDGILAGSSLPVVTVTDEVAQSWLANSGKQLKQLQDKLDLGDMAMGFELEDVQLAAKVDVKRTKGTGRNVLGRLRTGTVASEQVIVVGAHVDHLGTGASSSSLARDDEQQRIHFGADDNASGVAAMLEVAEYLADQTKRGKLKGRRDILFAAWSGEELGLLGSDHFVKSYAAPMSHGAGHGSHGAGHGSHGEVHHASPTNAVAPAVAHPTGPPQNAAHGKGLDAHQLSDSDTSPKQPASQHDGGNPHALPDVHGSLHEPPPLYPAIAACLNMDMVGRFGNSLILQGIGSSGIWRGEIERRNAPIGLPITLQEDSYLPTDASSFYKQGVPVLSAFTGSHAEYHTPRDTPDTLNYEGMADVAMLMGLIARSLAIAESPPDFVRQAAPQQQTRGRLRAYLGTIPDYAEEVKGVLLSGARKDGPADKAGVQQRDVIVELAGRQIENIYDYTHAIEALKIGEKVKMVIIRDDKRLTLEVTPESRE